MSVGQVHNFEVLSSSSVLLLLLFATSGLPSVAPLIVVDDTVSIVMRCTHCALASIETIDQLCTNCVVSIDWHFAHQNWENEVTYQFLRM